MLIAEMAVYYKEKGLSLYDQLQKIYEKYGFYHEFVESITMEGLDGIAKIKAIMENIRQNPPKTLGGKKVLAVRDYSTSLRTDTESGKTEEIFLPKSNVLYFELEDKNNFIVRPSGTEPKIKLYCLLQGKTPDETSKIAKLLGEDIKTLTK